MVGKTWQRVSHYCLVELCTILKDRRTEFGKYTVKNNIDSWVYHQLERRAIITLCVLHGKKNYIKRNIIIFKNQNNTFLSFKCHIIRHFSAAFPQWANNCCTLWICSLLRQQKILHLLQHNAISELLGIYIDIIPAIAW